MRLAVYIGVTRGSRVSDQETAPPGAKADEAGSRAHESPLSYIALASCGESTAPIVRDRLMRTVG
jgi:hypothetical protein